MSILDCIEAGNTFFYILFKYKKGFEVVKIVQINLNLIYRFKFNSYINYLQLPYTKELIFSMEWPLMHMNT